MIRTPFTRVGSQVQSLSRPPETKGFFDLSRSPLGINRQNTTGTRRGPAWKTRGIRSGPVRGRQGRLSDRFSARSENRSETASLCRWWR